jgi:hypothetical protein
MSPNADFALGIVWQNTAPSPPPPSPPLGPPPPRPPPPSPPSPPPRKCKHLPRERGAAEKPDVVRLGC